MTLLRFILLGYACISIFVAGGLFFRKSDGLRYKTISAFLFLFGIEIIEFLYSTSRIVDIYPFFYARLYFFSGFLYGPILLIHFKELLQLKSNEKYYLIHFVPALLAVILTLEFTLLPYPERLEFLRVHFMDRLMPLNYARAIHQLCYGMVFIHLIWKNQTYLSSLKRLYAISFCAIYFIMCVMISWLTAFAEGWRQFIYYYLLASSLTFISGFVFYKNPDFLKVITKKYLASTLSKVDINRIIDKIHIVMNEQKCYLDSNLSVKMLAGIIEEKPYNISQAFTEKGIKNFNTYVNEFRIIHAKKMLLDPKFKNYAIEGIALESGFNNKATFNRAFKEFVNLKPSEFKQMHV